MNGTSDEAASAPLWIAATVRKTPNAANRTAMYQNTTSGGFTSGLTESIYAIDNNKIAADGGKIAGTGWIKRTAGSGGRSGRVMTEVMVAGNVTTDAGTGIYKAATITISIQPATKSVNSGISTTFSVGATSVPVASLTYQWQANSGSGFANLTAAAHYSNVTTQTLTINPANSQVNTVTYRVLVGASGATSVTSSNATLTVV